MCKNIAQSQITSILCRLTVQGALCCIFRRQKKCQHNARWKIRHEDFRSSFMLTGLLLTKTPPFENATGGFSREIQHFCGFFFNFTIHFIYTILLNTRKYFSIKYKNLSWISRYRPFVDRSRLMLTSGLVLTFFSLLEMQHKAWWTVSLNSEAERASK